MDCCTSTPPPSKPSRGRGARKTKPLIVMASSATEEARIRATHPGYSISRTPLGPTKVRLTLYPR